MELLSHPPKYDPQRGASPKTLIYTIVQRAVMRFGVLQAKKDKEARPMSTSVVEVAEGLEEGTVETMRKADLTSQRRTTQLTRSRFTMDDILEYIDNEESRNLCRLVIECRGNVSEAARRLKLSEGTVRYRLGLLKPKLEAAGFGPLPKEVS